MRVSSTTPESAAPACNVGVAMRTLSGSKSIGATGGEIVRMPAECAKDSTLEFR